jgi:predicted anti-sigma-YlaC factor YlaD
MNLDCERIRPLLYTYIEREAEPAEAMLVAAHLSDCTACKILIARKRHLARMLESGLEDRIPVGEEFVRSVMATLPEGPPPAAPKSRRRRHLKLAGTIAVLLGVAPAVAARFPGDAGMLLGLDLPGLAGRGSGPYEAAVELARGTAGAAASWISGAPLDLSASFSSLVSLGTCAALAVGALAAGSGLLVLAAGSLLGSRRA